MAKRMKAKAPTKKQITAAADRAEARSKNAKTVEPKAKPAPEPAPEQRAIAMITEGNLTTLMRQVLKHQNDVSTASGNLGDLVRDYADKKNLHKGAFADIKKLYRMGKKDPGKLWLHLAHLDDMRKKLKLDELAGDQGQLVDAGTDEEDEDDAQVHDEAAGQPEPAPQPNVSRPKFGTGHANFGEGHGQVIKDAVAAKNPVGDIAKAAGASTATG